MNVLYLITVILLLITVMLIKKVDRKLNFIASCFVTIVAFWCYQAIVAYFLDLIKIPITLATMNIINMIVIVALWILYWLKIKKFQEYSIRKWDILFWIVFLAINIPVMYREFGFLENFRYISTDSVMHCQAAITFSKSDFLLDSMKNWEAINPTFMIGSYVNDGLLMKAVVNWIGEFNLYKVYMFMDISYYFLIGYIFFLLLTSWKECNQKLKYILAGMIVILFAIGYPLNSVITGFHYFTLGILEFITILYVIKRLYTEENKTVIYTLLFLLNTGVMLTYNLLAPIIYLTEFIYFIYEAKHAKERLITKSKLLELLIVLVIPGFIGLSFFFLPRLIENIVLENQQQLWIDGYIYINYWSNMIVFMPFVLYYIFKKAKENELDLETITFLIISIFMMLFFIGLLLNYVSVYYFMKLYFILDIMVFSLFFKGLCTLMDSGKIGKIISICFTALYMIILLVSLLFVNVHPYGFKKSHESTKQLFDIYNSNKAIMQLIQRSFTNDRMDTLKYIDENDLIDGQNLLYLGDYIDNFLFKLFFTYENREGIDKDNVSEHINKWNSGEYEYLVVFLKENYLKHYANQLDLNNSKVIFETDYCVIYQSEK